MRVRLERRTVAIAAVVVGLGAVGGGAAIAVTTGDDDASERPITGPALSRASAAALDHVGGGRVTDTEVGDEESLYEVEVTRPDGTQVDVQLDADFAVVSTKDDGDEAD